MTIDSGTSTEKSILAVFFARHCWANLHLIEACRTLTDDQLAHEVPGTYGSIRATLGHIIRAEERYLTLLMGQEFTNAPNPDPETPLAEWHERALRNGTELLHQATQIQRDTLVQVGEGDRAELLPASIVLLQIIYHADEHRAQINSILGQLGLTAPDLSAWTYYDDEYKLIRK